MAARRDLIRPEALVQASRTRRRPRRAPAAPVRRRACAGRAIVPLAPSPARSLGAGNATATGRGRGTHHGFLAHRRRRRPQAGRAEGPLRQRRRLGGRRAALLRDESSASALNSEGVGARARPQRQVQPDARRGCSRHGGSSGGGAAAWRREGGGVSTRKGPLSVIGGAAPCRPRLAVVRATATADPPHAPYTPTYLL